MNGGMDGKQQNGRKNELRQTDGWVMNRLKEWKSKRVDGQKEQMDERTV